MDKQELHQRLYGDYWHVHTYHESYISYLELRVHKLERLSQLKNFQSELGPELKLVVVEDNKEEAREFSVRMDLRDPNKVY